MPIRDAIQNLFSSDAGENHILTYKGNEYRFPNFHAVINDTLKTEVNTWGVTQADLDKSCPLTTEWDEFKNSIAFITQEMNTAILSADFTDIESNCDEILEWLQHINQHLVENRDKVRLFKDNDQTGCGNGRCREKACHDTGFWEITESYYTDMIQQVNSQIQYVNNVKDTITQIEEGTLDTEDLAIVVNNNAQNIQNQKRQAEADDRKKKFMLIGGIILGLVALIFIIRKIRKR